MEIKTNGESANKLTLNQLSDFIGQIEQNCGILTNAIKSVKKQVAEFQEINLEYQDTQQQHRKF